MIRATNVYLHDDLVGELRSDRDKGLSFKYDDRYVREKGPPLSLSMPLRLEYSYRSEAEAYFGGLLAHGAQRLALALELNVSPSDDLSLLRELGLDCVGAIKVMDDRQESRMQFKQLTQNALDSLIDSNTGLQTWLLTTENVRSVIKESGSSATLTLVNGNYYLPLHGAPSNAILRPNNVNTISPVNRYASALLAKRLGLNVPNMTLLRTAEGAATIEERHDRCWHKGAIEPLHVEDFSQSLTKNPKQQFEYDGGAGFVECIEHIHDHFLIPARDIDQFIKIFLFNALIGNFENCARSYHIVLDDDGPRLSSYSDLACSKLNRQSIDRLGMSVNGRFKISQIVKDDWLHMAKSAGLSGTGLVNQLQEMARTILEELPYLFNTPEFEMELQFQQDYTEAVRDNIKQLFHLEDLDGSIEYQTG